MRHKNIYVVDLDGTMYDNSHRQHLVPEDRNDTDAWTAFNCACADDVVRPAIRNLVMALLNAGEEVRFLTGRGMVAQEPTVACLVRDFGRLSAYSLTMRSMKNYQPAWAFKRDVMVGWLQEDPEANFLLLEDDPEIVAVLRPMDRVTVLQIDSLCADVRSK